MRSLSTGFFRGLRLTDAWVLFIYSLMWMGPHSGLCWGAGHCQWSQPLSSAAASPCCVTPTMLFFVQQDAGSDWPYAKSKIKQNDCLGIQYDLIFFSICKPCNDDKHLNAIEGLFTHFLASRWSPLIILRRVFGVSYGWLKLPWSETYTKTYEWHSE